jgi:DNA-binding PadR family transcriptional regulator
MMRGHLKTVVLTVLEEKDMSGSEIVCKLEKDFGWKPSPGSIYPVLSAIEEEGFAKVKCNDGECSGSNRKRMSAHKKIYSITQKGKLELKTKKIERRALADEILKVHKMMASIYDVKNDTNIEKVKLLTSQMKSGKMPFIQIHDETEALNAELFRILSKNILEKNKNKVKKIIKVAISDLKKIK